MEKHGIATALRTLLLTVLLMFSLAAQGGCENRGLTEEKLAGQTAPPAQSFGMKVAAITEQLRQQLGIADRSGVVVVEVEDGSLAAEAGIRAGDVIREVNRKPVKTVAEYNAAIGKTGKGQPVLFLVKRGKQTFYVSMEAS